MAILETKALVEEGIANAYASAGNKGATIPAQKNIKNLAQTIESMQTGGGIDSVQTVTDYPATEVKNTLYVRSLTPAQPYDAIDMKYNEKVIWEKESFTPTEGLVYTYRADTDDYMVGDGTTTEGNGFINKDTFISGMEINIPEYYDDGIHGKKRVTTIGKYAFRQLVPISKFNAPFVIELQENAVFGSQHKGMIVNIPRCQIYGRSCLMGRGIPDCDFSQAVSIGTMALYGSSLSKLHFGANVETISANAFDEPRIDQISSISVDANNKYFVCENNCLCKVDGTLVAVSFGNNSIYKFPDICLKIAGNACDNVFMSNNLVDLDLNKLVAFYDNYYSTTAIHTVLNRTTTIRLSSEYTGMSDRFTFEGCTTVILNKDAVPGVVKYITAKNRFSNITKIQVETGNTIFVVDDDIKLYSQDGTILYYYPRTGTSLDIRDTVTTFGQYCCAYNSNFENLTFDINKTLFKEGCFDSCVNLTSITFLATDYILEDYAFYRCGITTFNGSSTTLDLSNCYSIKNYSIYSKDTPITSSLTKIIMPYEIPYTPLTVASGIVDIEFARRMKNYSWWNFIVQKSTQYSVSPSSALAVDSQGILYDNTFETLILYPTNFNADTITLPSTLTAYDSTSFNSVFYASGEYSYIRIKKLIINSQLTLARYGIGCVSNIIRFNANNIIPIVPSSNYIDTKLSYKVHVPFNEISDWWVATNLSGWRSRFVGYKTYATGDTFPTTIVLANTTCNLTWYSDEALTTEAGATATADSEYYCTLQQA